MATTASLTSRHRSADSAAVSDSSEPTSRYGITSTWPVPYG